MPKKKTKKKRSYDEIEAELNELKKDFGKQFNRLMAYRIVFTDLLQNDVEDGDIEVEVVLTDDKKKGELGYA